MASLSDHVWVRCANESCRRRLRFPAARARAMVARGEDPIVFCSAKCNALHVADAGAKDQARAAKERENEVIRTAGGRNPAVPRQR